MTILCIKDIIIYTHKNISLENNQLDPKNNVYKNQ